jgi:hypothetical protein
MSHGAGRGGVSSDASATSSHAHINSSLTMQAQELARDSVMAQRRTWHERPPELGGGTDVRQRHSSRCHLLRRLRAQVCTQPHVVARSHKAKSAAQRCNAHSGGGGHKHYQGIKARAAFDPTTGAAANAAHWQR